MYILSQDKKIFDIIGKLQINDHGYGNERMIQNKGEYFGHYYTEEDAKKVLNNILFYHKQSISNFIYEMPNRDNIDNLKEEIIKKEDNKENIKIKIFYAYISDGQRITLINNLEEKVNNFVLKNNYKIIDSKIAIDFSDCRGYIMILYEEKENQNKDIKKDDIIAIDISSAERKIYNILIPDAGA